MDRVQVLNNQLHNPTEPRPLLILPRVKQSAGLNNNRNNSTHYLLRDYLLLREHMSEIRRHKLLAEPIDGQYLKMLPKILITQVTRPVSLTKQTMPISA